MSTLYLVDSNVIIMSFRDYYSPKRIPQFGPWLVKQGISGNIKIPTEIFGEIKPRDSELASWIEKSEVREALILPEKLQDGSAVVVLKEGYKLDNPTLSQGEKIGKDHFLIAHALADKANRVVVTKEVSKKSQQGINRHVPDVCKDMGVECINDFELYRRLDFNTRPKK